MRAVVVRTAKSANAIFAKELSRRLASRGVTVNSWIRDPSGCRSRQAPAQDAATNSIDRSTVHAVRRPASGDCSAPGGKSRDRRHIGRALSRCQITHGNPLLADEILIKRFWETSEQIVTAIA